MMGGMMVIVMLTSGLSVALPNNPQSDLTELASANVYTNLAGNVVCGCPTLPTPQTITLMKGDERMVYRWSIFPEGEKRRLAADAGSTQFVPSHVRLAIEGIRKAIKRSQLRAEKGLCTKEQSDSFCQREHERLNTYLEHEVDEGRLLPAERLCIMR